LPYSRLRVAGSCDVGVAGLTELSARIDPDESASYEPRFCDRGFFVLTVCGHHGHRSRHSGPDHHGGPFDL